MHSTRLCIFARPMSRFPDGAKRFLRSLRIGGAILLVVLVALGSVGCKELDGRNSNRHGNRLFREMQFIDAAAAYEKALKTVDDPIIHYNLGLAYSKMYRAGVDRAVLLGEIGDPVCQFIPGVKTVDARVCIKKPGQKTDERENIRRFPECDDKEVCQSSFTCTQTKLCSAGSPELADLAAEHFQVWIKVQPSDDELKKQMKAVREKLKAAEAADNKGMIGELEKRLEELTLKEDIRKLTTQVWIDTEQFKKAIAYWEAELAGKPKDPTIMGILGGINLKANDWRKSIEWYRAVADVSPDVDSKVNSLQFIGNVAWSKLNSKTLSPEEAVELADRGIGALQKAAELQPKVSKLWGLQASLYGFRSLVHGSMFAQAIDRASAEDLKRHTRVLSEEAKKLQQGITPATPTTPAPATPATPAAPGGPTNPAPPTSPPMSGGPAKTSGG
jgi:tetratricopeptide (TPR) repeat protein